MPTGFRRLSVASHVKPHIGSYEVEIEALVGATGSLQVNISPRKNGGENLVLVLQPPLENICHVCHLGRVLKR